MVYQFFKYNNSGRSKGPDIHLRGWIFWFERKEMLRRTRNLSVHITLDDTDIPLRISFFPWNSSTSSKIMNLLFWLNHALFKMVRGVCCRCWKVTENDPFFSGIKFDNWENHCIFILSCFDRQSKNWKHTTNFYYDQ